MVAAGVLPFLPFSCALSESRPFSFVLIRGARVSFASCCFPPDSAAHPLLPPRLGFFTELAPIGCRGCPCAAGRASQKTRRQHTLTLTLFSQCFRSSLLEVLPSVFSLPRKLNNLSLLATVPPPIMNRVNLLVIQGYGPLQVVTTPITLPSPFSSSLQPTLSPTIPNRLVSPSTTLDYTTKVKLRRFLHSSRPAFELKFPDLLGHSLSPPMLRDPAGGRFLNYVFEYMVAPSHLCPCPLVSSVQDSADSPLLR